MIPPRFERRAAARPLCGGLAMRFPNARSTLRNFYWAKQGGSSLACVARQSRVISLTHLDDVLSGRGTFSSAWGDVSTIPKATSRGNERMPRQSLWCPPDLEKIFEFLLVEPWKPSPIVAINTGKVHAGGIATSWETLSHQFATNQQRRANRPRSCPGEKYGTFNEPAIHLGENHEQTSSQWTAVT